MTPDALVWGFLLGMGSALHCAGMCGVIGCTLLSATDGTAASRPAWQRIVTMQVGRVAAYVALGLVFGALGAGVYRNLDFTSAHLAMQWLAAAVVVWLGLATAGLAPSLAGLDRALAPLAGLTTRARFALSRSGPEMDLVSGLLWGLTPCPMVYMAIFNAMLLGSIEQSMAMMLVFGLVTSVPVIAASLALHRAAGQRGRPHQRLAGLVLAGAGLLAFLLTAPFSPFCIT